MAKVPISIQEVPQTRVSEVDFDNIPFGKVFSDHVFISDYRDGKWQDMRIEPFQNMSISPATMALHYGQAIFEGMKADLTEDGTPLLFRPEMHAKRINISAERMAMPAFPEDVFLQALDLLIGMDKAWIPPAIGSALYIRPFMYASDGSIGVKASDTYRFMIFTGPVGPYYPKPVKIWVEEHYVRASRGGTGFAKAAGNYAASLKPAAIAREKGYDQILWLDGIEYKYLQECGTMNIFVVIGDTVLTPPTGDTILAGITRDSLIQIMKDKGIKVEERPITLKEVLEAHKAGTLKEMFGSGTAAVISHVEQIGTENGSYELPAMETRQIGPMLKEYYENLKAGRVEDVHSWLHPVPVPAAVK